MQSVTILTPHGHRYVVKVEPNKTVLWVLEQVCKKFPQFAPDNHGLKHHNKLVDLSMMFRFAGLPNNASLEMVEVEAKKSDGEVVICLQLEDGSRLNGNFPTSSNLRDVITAMCPEKSSPEQKPVVVYMRTEIHTEALDSTTLKSLGLTSGGRALLRLINTDPEFLKVQANISAPLPQKPREKSPERPRQRSNVVEPQSGPSNLIQAAKKAKQEMKEPEKSAEPMEVEETVDKIPSTYAPTPETMEETPAEPEPEPIINILDNRGTIIFSLDTVQTSSVELPDSFFELSESEVRKLYQELKIQADEIENRPLLTAEMRKLEENKKILNQLSIYKSCAIRVQMPNRFVIQSKFSTVEKVADVMELVKQFLVNPEVEFHLFVTPPKTILDKNETLIESNCVPSALLHFGCDIPGDHLKPEAYEKLSTGSGASRVLVSGNVEKESNEAGTSSAAKKPRVPQNFLQSKAASTPSTGAVPKWFKPGK